MEFNSQQIMILSLLAFAGCRTQTNSACRAMEFLEAAYPKQARRLCDDQKKVCALGLDPSTGEISCNGYVLVSMVSPRRPKRVCASPFVYQNDSGECMVSLDSWVVLHSSGEGGSIRLPVSGSVDVVLGDRPISELLAEPRLPDELVQEVVTKTNAPCP